MDGGERAAAVARGDIDELLRIVDACVERREWEEVADLRERCERAYLDSGRQLWPIASRAAYLLALDAPAPWAASVLVDDGDRFTLGPLPEVAAQRHEWTDLAPHLATGAAAAMTAHECVVRGADLEGTEVPGPTVLELPLRLAAWEPQYATATYHRDRADFPTPGAPRMQHVDVDRSATRLPADDVTAALGDLVRTWSVSSDGRVDVAAVEGSSLDAVAALGPPAVRAAGVDAATAVAWMAWAGASGGAHGRRPGAAAGRFGAWWVLGALAGVLDGWPPEPDALGAATDGLRWHLWDAGEPETGWALRVAVDDPGTGRAWALSAVDAA